MSAKGRSYVPMRLTRRVIGADADPPRRRSCENLKTSKSPAYCGISLWDSFGEPVQKTWYDCSGEAKAGTRACHSGRGSAKARRVSIVGLQSERPVRVRAEGSMASTSLGGRRISPNRERRTMSTHSSRRRFHAKSSLPKARAAPRQSLAHLKASAGFTLIELLVSVVILAVGLIGVASMVTYGVVSHRSSANYTIAAARATQEIERIRDAGYLSAQVGPALFPSPNYHILSATQVGFSVPESNSGQGVITLDEDSEAQATNPNTGLPYSNMKRVSVTISWGGARALTGSYTTTTLISNRP